MASAALLECMFTIYAIKLSALIKFVFKFHLTLFLFHTAYGQYRPMRDLQLIIQLNYTLVDLSLWIPIQPHEVLC